jgi:hypothetical protein
MEDQFAKNTGVISTAQGRGESNTVATAFRQEADFAMERRSEMRYRLYQAYAQIMLNMTRIMQRYIQQPIEISQGPIIFMFSGDTLRGVINYTIDVIDIERNDPLSDRLLEVQTIERILAHPALSAQFDAKELAKRIAQLNRWGNRVLVSRGPDEAGRVSAASGGPVSGRRSGTSADLGDGVDSGQLRGNTETAVEGAMMR